MADLKAFGKTVYVTGDATVDGSFYTAIDQATRIIHAVANMGGALSGAQIIAAASGGAFTSGFTPAGVLASGTFFASSFVYASGRESSGNVVRVQLYGLSGVITSFAQAIGAGAGNAAAASGHVITIIGLGY